MDVSETVRPPRRAILVPTTFGGVAALARGPVRWLAGWQVAVAVGAAAVFVWAAASTWGRAFEHAIESLPDEAAIQDGHLVWNQPGPAVLHQGTFVTLVVDPAGLREAGLSADVTLSLEARQVAMRSAFGWLTLPYPPGLRVSLGRLNMTGLLDAWRFPFLLGSVFAVSMALLCGWICLATVYSPVLWFMARALGWHLGLGRAWRLAGASLLPGALLMTASTALYATRYLGLVGFLFAVPTHFVLGWIFCIGGLPSAAARRSRQGNPFRPQPRTTAKRHPASANPFSF